MKQESFDRRKRIHEELMNILGLTEEYVLEAVQIISSDPAKFDIFFTLNGYFKKLHMEKLLRKC